MDIIASVHRGLMGSGLDALHQKAPLLAQRWSHLRGLDVEEHRKNPLHLRKLLSCKSSMNWQDDLAVALMALVIVFGIMGIGLVPSVLQTSFNPLWQAANMTLILSGSAVYGFFAAQAALLLLVAVAFRLLTFVPVASLVFGGVALFWWVSSTTFLFDAMLPALIVPVALMILLWLLRIEFERALKAHLQGEPAGTALGGLLGVAGALSLFAFSLWYINYFTLMWGLFVMLRGMFTGVEMEVLGIISAVLGLIILIIASIWGKKLMLAWVADEQNPPTLCAATAIWTMLMDVSTLGILAFFSSDPLGGQVPVEQAGPSGHGPAHSPSSPPSNPPEEPAEVRIGEHIQSGKYRKG